MRHLKPHVKGEKVTSLDVWDYRYIEMARLVAMWSKDPSTQCGAVIVRPDKTICSVGYNGFPRGMWDTDERLNNREEKYSRVIHAEVNAILSARERVEGYTLYTWPFLTCDRCAVQVIQSGIKCVITLQPPEDKLERWGASFEKTREYYKETGVGVIEL